jgi:tetratricopeptide (TPR) repeat protein
MGQLFETYLRYGISSDVAAKLESLELSVTVFRVTSIQKLTEHYGISAEEASWIKKCITRQPIDVAVLQELLENSNFVCCCCKGIKGDSYIIHHIIEYEISQDNSYGNLALLCPNDHDLAHRSPGLTNKLTPDQIRKSKTNWERQVRLYNLATSKHGEREQFILQLPRFQELQVEITALRERIVDKEKLIARSEAYFDSEMSKLKNQIASLEAQKALLEQHVAAITYKLAGIDLCNMPESYSEAVSHLLNADISGAIEILDEAKLDADLVKLEETQDKLDRSIQENADSRLLKAKLLTLNLQFAEARGSAGRGLQLYEELANRNPEHYMPELASCFEEVGTVYYNTGEYGAAEACFLNGLGVCEELQRKGIYAQLPLVALLLQNIGASHYSRGDYQTAKEYLEEANSLFSDIHLVYVKHEGFDYSDFEYQRAMTITNLGTVYKVLGMHDQARELLLQGRNAYEDLTTKDENEYLPGLMKNLSSLGAFYLATNDFDAAKEAYSRILLIARKLVASHRERYLEELADVLLNLCSLCLNSHDIVGRRAIMTSCAH